MEQVIKIYKQLFKSSKFIGTQPITFNKNNFNPNIDYYLTHKLDGKRILLFFTCSKVYMINSKMEFTEYTKFKHLYDTKLLDNTILDCEYFQNKFYIFDILYFSGKDLRNLKLSERIPYINRVHKLVHHKNLKIKNYLHNNICTDFDKLLLKLQINNKNTFIDGIIFTPNEGYKAVPLKWKPTHLLSIDFKIKKLGDNKIALLTQNGSVFVSKIKKYKDIGIIKLSEQKYKEYTSGQVIEFIFRNNKFVPIKTRPDKINSNHISVIISNFKTIINVPNVKKIIGC